MATKKKTVEAVTATSSPMVSMLRQAAGVEELTAIGNTDELVSNAMTVGEPTVVTIDSALSTTSTNPVQNKIVTAAINTNTANISTNTEDITSLKSALSADESVFNYLKYAGDKSDVVLEKYGYTWNTGETTTNSSYSRTNPNKPIKNNNSVLYFNNTDYSIGILGFREDGSYIGYAEDSWFSFDGYYIVSSTYPYFKMMFKRNDGSATTDADRIAISNSLKIISSILDDSLKSPDLPAKSKTVGDKIAELTNNANLLKTATFVRDAYYNGYQEASESYSYFILPIVSGSTYIIGTNARFIASEDSNIASNVTAGYSYTATYTGDLYVTFYNEDELGWSVYYETSNPANVTAYNEAITKRTDIYGCQLTDKVWYACGDSFTQGDFTGYSGQYRFTYTPYYGELMVYPYYIGRRTGAIIKNLAVGGMTMAVVSGSTNNFIETYQSIGADADYITLKFGINDGHQSVPIGTIDSTDTSTFYGAWNVVMTWLITNRPTAKIGIIVSNGLDSANYATATIAIANKYGIPYLNEWSGEQVPLMLRSGRTDVDASIKAIRDETFRVSESNQHPNPTSHEYESTIVEAWLKSL